jgi:hypothetical protein
MSGSESLSLGLLLFYPATNTIEIYLRSPHDTYTHSVNYSMLSLDLEHPRPMNHEL